MNQYENHFDFFDDRFLAALGWSGTLSMVGVLVTIPGQAWLQAEVHQSHVARPGGVK